MAIINDTDLLVVQKGGNNYTYSGANLKADITEIGGAAGGGVTKINAGSNVSISPTSGVGEVTISASGGSTSTPGLGTVCAVNSDASAHSVSFRGVTCGNNITAGGKIEASGELKGPSGHRIVNDGGIFSPHTVNVSTSGDVIRHLYIGTSNGLFRSNASRSIEEISNATEVDTSDYTNVLSNVKVIQYNDGQFGVKPDTLNSDSRSQFLTYDAGEVNPIVVPIYLMEVCKQQQQLIENLTTRIEQLEADHASAMNNMEDENGSSAY